MMIMMREKEERLVDPLDGGANLTCEEFQAHLPDIMGTDIHEHEHLKTCERCTALIEELSYIAEIAKGLMPGHDPSASLWDKIANSLHQAQEEDGKEGGNRTLLDEKG